MTGKQISGMSDFAFAAWVLQEKLDRISNPNTPLAAKLRMAIHSLRNEDAKEKTRPNSSWFVQFYDENGNRLLPQEMDEYELDRIGNLVKTGFGSGEIVTFRKGCSDE